MLCVGIILALEFNQVHNEVRGGPARQGMMTCCMFNLAHPYNFVVCNYIHVCYYLQCACVSEIKQSVCLLAILSSCQYVSIFANPL